MEHMSTASLVYTLGYVLVFPYNAHATACTLLQVNHTMVCYINSTVQNNYPTRNFNFD